MILTIIGIDVFYGSTKDYEAIERENDLTIISNALERYYRTGSNSSGPSYPAETSDIGKKIEELVEDKEAVIAPGEKSNSIRLDGEKKYVYRSYNRNGVACKSEPCVRYRLEYYTLESYTFYAGGSMHTNYETNYHNIINSMRQQ